MKANSSDRLRISTKCLQEYLVLSLARAVRSCVWHSSCRGMNAINVDVGLCDSLDCDNCTDDVNNTVTDPIHFDCSEFRMT